MEPTSSQPQSPQAPLPNDVDLKEKKHSHYWKFFISFVLLFALAVGGILALSAYDKKKNEMAINDLANAIKDAQKQDYEDAMKDTYGGKTPQETLLLYISAVEKGDYELASKYFIGTRQADELQSLKDAKANNKIPFLLSSLKKINLKNGYFSTQKDRFTAEDPLFIDFKMYPNNIWKITEFQIL